MELPGGVPAAAVGQWWGDEKYSSLTSLALQQLAANPSFSLQDMLALVLPPKAEGEQSDEQRAAARAAADERSRVPGLEAFLQRHKLTSSATLSEWWESMLEWAAISRRNTKLLDVILRPAQPAAAAEPREAASAAPGAGPGRGAAAVDLRPHGCFPAFFFDSPQPSLERYLACDMGAVAMARMAVRRGMGCFCRACWHAGLWGARLGRDSVDGRWAVRHRRPQPAPRPIANLLADDRDDSPAQNDGRAAWIGSVC